MTMQLKEALILAEKLPEHKQNMVAAMIASLVENKRPIGLAVGRGRILPSFFDPMSEEELADWHEGHADDPLKTFE